MILVAGATGFVGRHALKRLVAEGERPRCLVRSQEKAKQVLPVDQVDLALIGHGFRGSDKRKIANLVNHYYPGLPILEMCFNSPEIPGADFVLSDSPDDLIAAIKLVLAGRRVRGYPE